VRLVPDRKAAPPPAAHEPALRAVSGDGKGKALPKGPR